MNRYARGLGVVAIDDYQSNGIAVFEPGSDAVVTDNVINPAIAPGEVVFTGGLEVGDGAVARVMRNLIIGNRCTSPDLLCGPDPMSQNQASGIGNGPFLPPGLGTEFAYNVIAGNDIGIYLVFVPNCCLVHDNVLLNNLLFGIAIQDEDNTVSNDLIVGGRVGVAAIADAVDTTATLKHERIFGSSVARTQELQCCGVKATIIEQ